MLNVSRSRSRESHRHKHKHHSSSKESGGGGGKESSFERDLRKEKDRQKRKDYWVWHFGGGCFLRRITGLLWHCIKVFLLQWSSTACLYRQRSNFALELSCVRCSAFITQVFYLILKDMYQENFTLPMQVKFYFEPTPETVDRVVKMWTMNVSSLAFYF